MAEVNNTSTEQSYPRDCPKCFKGTNNYYLCNKCVEELVANGTPIEELWEIEEDNYILSGLDKLAHK